MLTAFRQEFQQQVNMCSQVTHSYTCGHSTTDKIPCATSKVRDCKKLDKRHIPHTKTCFRCGSN